MPTTIHYAVTDRVAVLTIDNPPGMVAVELPACSAYARDKACPLERFVEIANAAIDPACVSIKP